MKEELQSKLVEILGSIQATAGKAGDFAMAQLPDIAQSYVIFGRAYYVFMTLLGVAAVALAIYLLLIGRRAFNAGEEEYRKHHPKNEHRILYRDSFPMGVPYFLISGATGLVGALLLLSNVGTAMLVWFAPKVWLLKEIAGLVK